MPISQPYLKSKPNGFTLIEMLVVLAIIALATGLFVAGPLGENKSGDRQTAAQLAFQLNSLRTEAFKSGSTRAFDASKRELKYSAQIGGGVTLLFFADGSSSGGTILSEDGIPLAEIDWRSGRVKNVR